MADDTRIVEAHEQTVMVALDQLQAFAATRVRKRGQCTDRTTGNLVAAVFRHDTSRALDPHLHCHAIVFNATLDPMERRWKALQNHDMLAAQSSCGACSSMFCPRGSNACATPVGAAEAEPKKSTAAPARARHRMEQATSWAQTAGELV